MSPSNTIEEAKKVLLESDNSAFALEGRNIKAETGKGLAMVAIAEQLKRFADAVENIINAAGNTGSY